MEEIYEGLKAYVLKITRESHEANPQEIAVLPALIKILEEHYENI